jgi:RNA processing factor Prp31
LYNSLKVVGDFIKDHVIPNLRAIVTALVAMKAAKAAGGVGKLIGGAIGSIFGPAGALIGSAIGGGVAALAAGTTAGVMTHDALKGLEDKNKTEDEFDKMIRNIRSRRKKRAECTNDKRQRTF